MEIFSAAAVFVLGTIVGSFLNVAVLRYHTGLSIWGGRLAPHPSGARGAGSFCFSCGHKLAVRDLVPILSFLILGGRCRYCQNRISWQYPIVEALTGLIFAAIFFKLNELFPFLSLPYILNSVFYILVFSLLIFISVHDFRRKIIPERPVWIFAALTLVWSLGLGKIENLAAGPILALPFASLWLFSKGRWMGLGDAKLVLGIGFLLGLSAGLASILISFWLGALTSLFLLLFHSKSFKIKSEIPFGPFLVLGAFLVFLMNMDFADLVGLFQ